MNETLGMNIEAVIDETIVPHLPKRFLLSSGSRILPSFFLAGVEKCGTSSLFKYLLQHKQIIAPQRKDTYFFSNNNRYNKGINFYKAFFAHKAYKKLIELKRGNKVITFDSTPIYFDYPEAPGRIKQMFPDAKIVILLRDPVERAFSNYNMAIKFGFETLNFSDAIQLEEKRVEWFKNSEFFKGHNFAFQRIVYKSRGEYIRFIPEWKKQFGENLYIEFAENLSSNPTEAMRGILNFLQLENASINFDRVNEGEYNVQMTDAEKQLLTNHYEPFNKDLSLFLGKSLPWMNESKFTNSKA